MHVNIFSSKVQFAKSIWTQNRWCENCDIRCIILRIPCTLVPGLGCCLNISLALHFVHAEVSDSKIQFESRSELNRTEPNYTKRCSFGVVYFQFGWFHLVRPALEMLIFQLEKHTFPKPRFQTINLTEGAVAIFKTMIPLCLYF